MSKTPSIAVIPSGYKGGVSGVDGTVYSVLPTNGDADLDFTRNCEATRTNQNGLIETVGLNVPRLDYSDGGCPSLLLEPQRTNLVTNSEDFTTKGNWFIGNNTVVTSDSSVSPNGNTTASRFFMPLGGGSYISTGFSATIGSTYTFSFYGKNNGGGLLTIGFGTTQQLFDNLISSNPILLSNEWERYSISYTATDTTTLYIGFDNDDNLSSIDAYIFGAQIEEGSYATSYIPTNGATVTRFKDSASKDNLESYINSSEGVFYVEFNVGVQTSYSRFLTVSDGSKSNRIMLSVSGGTKRIDTFISGGGATTGIGCEVADLTQNQKVALKWKQNEFKLFINGALESTSTNIQPLPINMDSITYSQGDGSRDALFGKTKDIRVFNEALTDAELIELTTI